ncbi:glycosyltransferase [Spirosoma fluminis]
MDSFDSIICVSQTTWEGDFQKSVVQLMTELSARHPVLFIDYQYTVKDWVRGAQGKQDVPVRELVGLADSLTKKTGKNGQVVYVWTPPLMLPINWLPNTLHDRFLALNSYRFISGLKRVMRRLNMRRPVIVNALNPVFGVPMLDKLNELATVYYCFDEISFESWISRHGSRYEPQYIQRVTSVITTSESLRQAKSALQPNTFCVKNGVNFDLFNQALALAEANPPQKPVVGYLGSMDNRMDLDLVEYCVRIMSDVSFQFIGEINQPLIPQRLAAYPNVTFTPPHQPPALPALLANMKVAIIPYLCNEHTYTIYPLKINEYLAAGLPVVSTPFSILDDFAGVVDLAREPETFAEALRRALADDSPERVAERVNLAKANSWEKRAEAFEAVLHQAVRSAAAPVLVADKALS